MPCLADLEELIFNYADTHGADWLAMIPGGLHRGKAPDCAAGSSPKTPYCIWNWVGTMDIRDSGQLRDREFIQFAFYGPDGRKIDEIIEGCIKLFAASHEDLKDLDPVNHPDLRMRSGSPPSVPAAYDDDDKSRFALWVGMAQFEIDFGKTPTILT